MKFPRRLGGGRNWLEMGFAVSWNVEEMLWLSESTKHFPVLFVLAFLILPALVAGIAVATERTDKRLRRGRYCLAFALQVLLPLTLYVSAWPIILTLVFNYGPTNPQSAMKVAQYFDFLGFSSLRIAVDCTLSALAARLLVRRLRDAVITEWLAYLAVVPYLNVLVFLAFATYPPSRRPETAPAKAM